MPAIAVVLGAALVALLVFGLTQQGSSRALDEAVAAGRTPAAPDATRPLPVLDGVGAAQASLARWRGKVVVVNFWATWCVPCVQEIPGFNKVHREYGSKGVVVVGVSMDDDGAQQVPPFLKKHPMDYTVALGSDATFKQYAIDELPVTVVFDRSGKQVKRFDGFTAESAIEDAVRHVL